MNEVKISMQVFGNVATEPVSKESRTTQKRFTEFRLAEGHKNLPGEVSWYTIRVMHDRPLNLAKGDFVKVTGRLKVDSYLMRESGKPTSTLLILAFEASKIAKPPSTAVEQKVKEDVGAPTPVKPAAVEVAWQD